MQQQLPKNIYRAEQVRELDRLAIKQQGITGIELMHRAGRSVFDHIQQLYAPTKLVVFCGAGNNAGDGYVIAKLALQAGLTVDVVYVMQPDHLQSDTLIAYREYLKAGGHVSLFETTLVLTGVIIVDALLGTGLNREVTGHYAEAIALINATDNAVVSVDIPSGLNADTGNVMPCAVKADYTVCFIGLKQGMVTGMAAEYCGEIIFTTLAIPEQTLQQVPPSAKLIRHFNLSRRHRCSHKGHHGHVLLIGGDKGYSGAIRLAAEASLRIGAGLVSVATREYHAAFINTKRPEIMSHGVETVLELEPLLNKATIIAIGPGLGQSQWARRLFSAVTQSDHLLVIDADALNLLAKQKSSNENWVLTPHLGEAARLLDCTPSVIANDRFLAVSTLQKTYRGIVVLKGSGTLIANSSEIVVSPTGNPGMATGGMGDVLTGMIAGLIAQGISLDKAAAAAVYLHGAAADLSAQQAGEVGLLASDLMPFIRQLVNE